MPPGTRRIPAILASSLLIAATFGSAAQTTVDHSAWTRLLEATVSEAGWVDYEAIRTNWAGTLRNYVAALGEVEPNALSSDSERKAFWINAYNAVTIQTLLDEGLPETVPHAAFFGKNIFRQKTYGIAGKVRSLDEIEHRILRQRFSDPRIHAALVCGASSCPRLRAEAFTGDALDRQLDEEARRWIRAGRNRKGERKNRLDRGEAVFRISAIFKWFAEDFDGGAKAGVLSFLKRYADPETREYLQDHEVELRYRDYDWSLNNRPKDTRGT